MLADEIKNQKNLCDFFYYNDFFYWRESIAVLDIYIYSVGLFQVGVLSITAKLNYVRNVMENCTIYRGHTHLSST